MRTVPALLLVLCLGGCAWLRPGEERAGGDEAAGGLSVVPDGEPFDPSKVVEDTGPGQLARSAGSERGAKEERVGTEAEAQAQERQIERAVERIDETDEDDDEAKVQIASNPPAKDAGSGERWTETVKDLVLEIIVVVALALLLAGPLWLLLRV